VEFGVSPAGVWRNRSHDPAGSDTRGAAAYDESYADTRLWVQQGLLDYMALLQIVGGDKLIIPFC